MTDINDLHKIIHLLALKQTILLGYVCVNSLRS